MALYDNMKLEKGMYQTAGKSFTLFFHGKLWRK